MPFSCKVTMPGPYADSVTKAREIESRITPAAEQAMSYVMNLRPPEAPRFNVLDPLWFSKSLESAQATMKYNLIHTAIEKAKATLVQVGDADSVMTAFLRTEGVAEILSFAASILTQDAKLDFSTAALASAAWYLKSGAKCVGGKKVYAPNGERAIKTADGLYAEVLKRARLTEKELYSFNCFKGNILNNLDLAILIWARNLAKGGCGRRPSNEGSGKTKGVGGFGTQAND